MVIGLDKEACMAGVGAQREAKLSRRRKVMLVAALAGALASGIAASAVAYAQSRGKEAEVRREYEVPASNPESVVYDKQTEFFYGGSSNDGTVYRATLDGKTEVFLPPLRDGTGEPDPTRTQTQGFDVDAEGRLYIAGGGSGFIHVYDVETGRKLAEFNTGPGGFINGVDDLDGSVYLTDSTRPFIFRITQEQIDAGGGVPEAIPLEPEVNYTPNPRTPNNLEANGITSTPDGRYLIFGSLDNGKIYRMTPPPVGSPEERKIKKINGLRMKLGDVDGIEFVGKRTLYAVDNNRERINEVRLSESYLKAEIVSRTTSPEFRTPTDVSPIPGGRLLVNNAEFFDASEPGPPFFVTSIERP